MAGRVYTWTEILAKLDDGGEIWYFYLHYLHGEVAVHGKGGEPVVNRYCPMGIFIELRDQGLIVKVRSNPTGRPFYADNMKSEVYARAKKVVA